MCFSALPLPSPSHRQPPSSGPSSSSYHCPLFPNGRTEIRTFRRHRREPNGSPGPFVKCSILEYFAGNGPAKSNLATALAAASRRFVSERFSVAWLKRFRADLFRPSQTLFSDAFECAPRYFYFFGIRRTVI